MRQPSWLVLFLALLAAPTGYAATRDNERPDREMLRMMEFLREMEMIKQMEILQEIHQVEYLGEAVRGTTAQKSSPAKKKEGVR